MEAKMIKHNFCRFCGTRLVRRSRTERSCDCTTGAAMELVIPILQCDAVSLFAEDGHNYFEPQRIEVTTMGDPEPVYILGELPASDVPSS